VKALLAAAGAALVAQLAAAQPAAPPGKPPRGPGAAGMVITGDQEAPQVLTIVPWQEPRRVDPAPLPALPALPTVLDHERTLAEEPLSRPLAGGR
jgi:hypothetical protein